MVLTSGKYFIKTVFEIKIKVDILEISIVRNFRKFCSFLILGLL